MSVDVSQSKIYSYLRILLVDAFLCVCSNIIKMIITTSFSFSSHKLLERHIDLNERTQLINRHRAKPVSPMHELYLATQEYYMPPKYKWPVILAFLHFFLYTLDRTGIMCSYLCTKFSHCPSLAFLVWWSPVSRLTNHCCGSP